MNKFNGLYLWLDRYLPVPTRMTFYHDQKTFLFMFIPLRKTTARAPAICAVDTVIRDVQSTLVKFIIVLTQEGNVGSQIQTTLKKNACADAGKSVRSKSMTVSNNMSQAPQVVSTLTVIKKRMGIIQI